MHSCGQLFANEQLHALPVRVLLVPYRTVLLQANKNAR